MHILLHRYISAEAGAWWWRAGCVAARPRRADDELSCREVHRTRPADCCLAARKPSAYDCCITPLNRHKHTCYQPQSLTINTTTTTTTVIYERTMCASHNCRYTLCCPRCSPWWPPCSTHQAPTRQPGILRRWSDTDCVEQFAFGHPPTTSTFKNLLKTHLFSLSFNIK